MKRVLITLATLLLLVSMVALPVSATESTDQLLSRSIEYLDNGDRVITEVYRSAAQPFSGTNGYKTSTYIHSNGSSIFSVTVNGTFTYNGSASSATSASATVRLINANASFVSKNAYASGAAAFATGTVNYGGINITRTVSLTCDRNGNLY